MKKAEGHRSAPGRQLFNPKAQLNPSEVQVRPKDWNGKRLPGSVSQPARPKPSGPRPKPKRK